MRITSLHQNPPIWQTKIIYKYLSQLKSCSPVRYKQKMEQIMLTNNLKSED